MMPGVAWPQPMLPNAEARSTMLWRGALDVLRMPSERISSRWLGYCITERLIYAAKGKTDEALLFCGADAYKVNKITTVKKVFKELLEEKEV